MPRRTILSDAELASLLALPDTEAELIRCYIFSDADLAVISQHRGSANRSGFAVQLCYMRYPGDGRLRLEAKPGRQTGKIPTASPSPNVLTCFISRFLRRPHLAVTVLHEGTRLLMMGNRSTSINHLRRLMSEGLDGPLLRSCAAYIEREWPGETQAENTLRDFHALPAAELAALRVKLLQICDAVQRPSGKGRSEVD